MDISLGVLFENSIVCHVFYAIWSWGLRMACLVVCGFWGLFCFGLPGFWLLWLGVGLGLVWFSGLLY